MPLVWPDDVAINGSRAHEVETSSSLDKRIYIKDEIFQVASASRSSKIARKTPRVPDVATIHQFVTPCNGHSHITSPGTLTQCPLARR
jgi:hypothetical protein